ncbi:hypothetical protein ACFSTE_13100 [Aquimarina hainanensis]|uniref:ABC transporter permease n=1 Tax=Aquimarina hainanensis TaxID=1578017 RepID=A0ABW5N830_9FLAO|nr:hypothetical protein [Aquimarina sp. TRL1]QKX03641.1 hypothetical protein HN014_01500 [Aquimarina sp. TRL1]
MLTVLKNHEPLRKFLFKRAVVNGIFNCILNYLIQYYSLLKFESLAFFEGEQSMAKVFLPLLFLLPFFVTLDVVKRTYKEIEKEKLSILHEEDFKWLRFARIQGVKNGGIAIGIGFVLLLVTLQLLPEGFRFDKAYILGVVPVLAGVLAVVYTYLPIIDLRKKQKLIF